MEHTPSKLAHETYNRVVSSWSLDHGSYLVEGTTWKLPHATYTMKIT